MKTSHILSFWITIKGNADWTVYALLVPKESWVMKCLGSPMDGASSCFWAKKKRFAGFATWGGLPISTWFTWKHVSQNSLLKVIMIKGGDTWEVLAGSSLSWLSAAPHSALLPNSWLCWPTAVPWARPLTRCLAMEVQHPWASRELPFRVSL